MKHLFFVLMLFVSQYSTAQLSVTLTASDALCNNSATGTAEALASGGASNYTYQWSSGAIVDSVTNLAAGTYFVTVTDGVGASVVGIVVIAEPTSVVIDSIATIDNICTTSARVYVSGGTGNYSYLWSDGRTAARIYGLIAGTYLVTVTDGNGCSVIDSTTIIHNVSNQLNGYTNSADALCYGSSTGELGVILQGGMPPYSVLWGTNPVQTGLVADSLSAGTHNVSITDANNCTLVLTGTVGEPSELIINAGLLQSVTCFEGSNGIANVLTTTGGIPPYSYVWTDPNNQIGLSATNLEAGAISVIATDANGCTAIDTVTVIEGDSMTVITDVRNVSCVGRQDGVINIMGSNKVLVSYSWSNGNIGNPLIGLNEGGYTVATTDVGGCQDTFTYTVETPIISITTSNESCYLMVDGTASAQVNSPMDSLTYVWSTNLNGLTFSTDSIVTGLIGNVYDINGDGILDTSFHYIVTVSDTTGCSWTDIAYILRADLLDLLVLDNNNGTAEAYPTGGTAPYSYLWSANANNQTTALATGLVNETYFVTVTDTMGCFVSDSVTINVGINQIASLETFNLYPNPNQGAFQLEVAFKENVVGILEVKDVLGKTILQQTIEGQQIQEWIQLENKVAGIYFLSLNVGGQMITTKIEILK
jgi:hypothetical protein